MHLAQTPSGTCRGGKTAHLQVVRTFRTPAGCASGDMCWATLRGVRSFVRFAPPSFAPTHGLAQQPFDLGVDRAQIVAGPALELAPKLGLDAEQELLARRHRFLSDRVVG